MDAYQEAVVDMLAEGTLVDGKYLVGGYSRLVRVGERIEHAAFEGQGTRIDQY